MAKLDLASECTICSLFIPDRDLLKRTSVYTICVCAQSHNIQWRLK